MNGITLRCAQTKCEGVVVQIRVCAPLKPDTSVRSALRWLRLTDLPPLPKGHGRAITDASEGHRGGGHPYGAPAIQNHHDKRAHRRLHVGIGMREHNRRRRRRQAGAAASAKHRPIHQLSRQGRRRRRRPKRHSAERARLHRHKTGIQKRVLRDRLPKRRVRRVHRRRRRSPARSRI